MHCDNSAVMLVVAATLRLNAQPTARSLQSGKRETDDHVFPPDTVMPDGQLPMRRLALPVVSVVVETATGNAGVAPVSTMLVPEEMTIPVLATGAEEETNSPATPPQPYCDAVHFAMRLARAV